MSRIGKKPVPIPKGVTVNVNGLSVRVKGPRGELMRVVHPGNGRRGRGFAGRRDASVG